MAELETPVLEQPTTPAPPAPPTQKMAHEKKKKKKKLMKNLIIVFIVLAVVALAAFLIWKFVLSDPKEVTGEPLYDTASISSIASTVQGGGSANAKASATITLSQGGIVQEIFVAEGQVVTAGDPLYIITSAAAEAALSAANESLTKQQEGMNTLLKDMSDLQKSRSDLTITAPHAGKLTEAAAINVGDPLAANVKVAVVVDDTKLKLSLYYSYAYEHDISVGQTASISVPATMTTLLGKVETINKVERIVPEGGKTFEVIFVVDNPGTLTAEMAASAALKTAAGVDIFPYEGGTFSYYKTTTLSTKAEGPVEQVKGLMNYSAVTPGQVLVVQGTNIIDEQIKAKQEQITTAQKGLDDAVKKVEEEQKNLQNFSAVAPITGTVTSCVLTPGLEVASGLAAVSIADNTVMSVNINVDERNIQYVKTGMTINFNGYSGSYMGIVESVAVVGKNENGVTTYPAVVKVDNPDGSLMGGMWMDYNFTAAQSDGCIVIPLQDVHYASLGAEKPSPLVYVKTETAPENAVDKTTLPEDMQKGIPADCFVVPVEIGLADEMNVEIKSGLNEGDQVFNGYSTNSADSWNQGGGSIMVG